MDVSRRAFMQMFGLGCAAAAGVPLFWLDAAPQYEVTFTSIPVQIVRDPTAIGIMEANAIEDICAQEDARFFALCEAISITPHARLA